MWDRPDILNIISNALFALACVLIAWLLALFVMRLPVFALHEVRVSNALMHVTRDQIEDVARRDIAGNFFTLDLARLRAGFERLPWVRSADVRRAWPDRVDVALEEQVPLARWGDAALVNVHGEVFAAASDGAPASREQGSRLRDATGRESGAALSSAGVASVSGVTSPKGAPVLPSDGALPVFIGPDAASAEEIAIQYDYFRRGLAAVNETPVQVRMSPRRAWEVRLASGLTLELGRDDVETRLDHFIAVYARTVGQLPRRPDYVDLRYSNGFAVRVPG